MSSTGVMLFPAAVPSRVRAHGGPVRVLVVDDESHLSSLVVKALRYEGWRVESARTGLDAVRTAVRGEPDLIVLDATLPDASGREVARRLHGAGMDVPLLFLVPLDADRDELGLTSGADDYVFKPFSVEEVVARLRAQIRRLELVEGGVSAELRVGDLVLDEDTHEVERAGEAMTLTSTEFELLRFLMRNPSRVVSKAQIMDRVWPYDFTGSTAVVELYISYLRKKVDAGRAPMIVTRRGSGYLLKPTS
jgi:two-component system, OmpR family, response regulator